MSRWPSGPARERFPLSSDGQRAYRKCRPGCGSAGPSDCAPPGSHDLRACLADGDLHPPQEVLAQRLGHQDARLELQHARVEGREDRPHTVLVKMTHDRLGAFGMVELQAHHHPVLADADEEVRIEIAY